jgi:hypothetical protein
VGAYFNNVVVLGLKLPHCPKLSPPILGMSLTKQNQKMLEHHLTIEKKPQISSFFYYIKSTSQSPNPSIFIMVKTLTLLWFSPILMV